MDRDLHQALTTGELAPTTGLGLAIGVWKQGERRAFTYGAARQDSIFEIGSVSKTFTGLMLAQMVVEKKVQLDQPVRELLPPGTVTKPTGSEITLLDLATHHSGLPSLQTTCGSTIGGTTARESFMPTSPATGFQSRWTLPLYIALLEPDSWVWSSRIGTERDMPIN